MKNIKTVHHQLNAVAREDRHLISFIVCSAMPARNAPMNKSRFYNLDFTKKFSIN